MAEQQLPFRFLDLPPEIREKIYILISTKPFYHISLSSYTAHAKFPLNLLLTNHQIYQEARPTYFTHNDFCITIRRRNEDWDHILSHSWLDNLRQIHKLRIYVLRWGTKNFFTHKVVPALEDCILNGHLRILDVVVRDSSLKLFENVDSGEESCEPWNRLRMLCRDPYLESVRLLAAPTDILIPKIDGGYELNEDDLRAFQDITWLINKPFDTRAT